MNTNSTKAELRAKLLKQRRGLNADELTRRSQKIVVRLISEIDWGSHVNMHVFLPLNGDNEPDIRAFISRSLEMSCNIYTTDPSAQTGRKVVSLESAVQHSQIKQYELGQDVSFDYIIVPMIAFDPETNNRLGFGGGFYDRLIAEQTDARAIGVCFSEFATSQLPVEAHDQKLDKIIVA